MKEAFIIIATLSVILFIIITIVRIVATIFLKYTIRKYQQLLALIRPKDSNNDNNYIPSSRNDVLYRDKDLEKKKAQELAKIEKNKQQAAKIGNVTRLSRATEAEEPNYNKKNIVGMVKPIGYWTSLIMGQRVTYLMQQANILREQNDAGYWVTMMNARDRSGGKSRGL